MKKNLKIATIAIMFISIILLTIVGNVYAEDSIFSITSVSAEGKSQTADVEDLSFEGTAINSDIVFHQVDDYVKCKITIKNNTDQDYKIKAITDNNENSYISYDYSESINTLLEANGTADIYITIKYVRGNDDIALRVQNINADITITLEDYLGNTVDETVSINPKTGDPIVIYMVIFVASVIALIVFAIFSKKGKKSKKVLGLIVAIILVAPVMVKAADSSLGLTFKNKATLKNKLVLTYIDESGEEEEAIVNYGDSTEDLNVVEKDNYNFLGWYDQSGNKVEKITDDVKVTPIYEAKEFKITYDLTGGTGDTETIYTIESDSFTLPKPRRSGFMFKGWTGDNGDTPQKSVVISQGSTGNRSYTANWEEINVEIDEEYIHPSDSEYCYFGGRTSDWESSTEVRTTYPWYLKAPCFTFEDPISRVRLGYSATEYVTYNAPETVFGYIDTDTRTKVWFGSGTDGSAVDGYYTFGYTIDGDDHEMRFQVSSGEIVDIEQIY